MQGECKDERKIIQRKLLRAGLVIKLSQRYRPLRACSHRVQYRSSLGQPRPMRAPVPHQGASQRVIKGRKLRAINIWRAISLHGDISISRDIIYVDRQTDDGQHRGTQIHVRLQKKETFFFCRSVRKYQAVSLIVISVGIRLGGRFFYFGSTLTPWRCY